MNNLVFNGLMLFGLIVILIISVVIRIKLDYLKDSLKNALTIIEGQSKIYRSRAIEFSQKISNEIKSEKDFDLDIWLNDLKVYFESIGIMKGLNMAIRILKFWLPKNL
jgi:hypothetical protein